MVLCIRDYLSVVNEASSELSEDDVDLQAAISASLSTDIDKDLPVDSR